MLTRPDDIGQERTVAIHEHEKFTPIHVVLISYLKNLMYIPGHIYLPLILILSIGPPLIKNRIVRICLGVLLVAVIFAGLFGFVR